MLLLLFIIIIIIIKQCPIVFSTKSRSVFEMLHM